MNKLAFIEFSTIVTLGDTSPEQEAAMSVEAWLEGQEPVAGGIELLERLTKEGWAVYLMLPLRSQNDKTLIQDWLANQKIPYKKLDVPRAINPANLNPQRWIISRLHDMSEFEEPQRMAALLQPETLQNLNKQLSGALMDWQPKSLVTATTIEQATSRFLGGLRSLPVRTAQIPINRE